MRFRLLLLLSMMLITSNLIAQNLPQPIVPGTTSGAITDENFSTRYSFTAEAGQSVTITMNAIDDSLDPFLFLFDSDEQLITVNDDVADGNRNAAISFTPDTGGTFIIEATRYRQDAGDSTGTYTLTLTLGQTITPVDTDDPLTNLPAFGVSFDVLPVAETLTNFTLDSSMTREYFAIGGTQGELLRVTVRTTGNLELSVNLLNERFTVISRVGRVGDGQYVIYAAIPQSGWYLVEVARQSGTGTFTIRADVISSTVLTQETPIEASFRPGRQELQYIFNATINERVFVNLTITDDVSGIMPTITLLDLEQNVLIQRQSTGTQTRATLTVPRSGPYIVIVSNEGRDVTASFQLEMRRIGADISKLQVTEAQYNESYTGTITDDSVIDYYRFSGKAGELVTIQMSATSLFGAELDPYLILTDGNLNELVFNDNIGASRTARITQFALTQDGDFFILATRAGLQRGTTSGDYNLTITVGQIALETGNITATLRWEGDADLNLFVGSPDGQFISWANPTPIESDAFLQIDSNTGCNTPTAQPVEHIVFDTPTLQTGDYTVWVWYQEACSRPDPVPFSLTISANGDPLFSLDSQAADTAALAPDERFEVGFRITESGNAVPLNRGIISQPTPQQRASQGGDTLIIYGQSLVGTITDTVYARFYQFNGSAGDRVVITAQRVTGSLNPLDPVLVLRDNFENNLAISDDISEDNYNSQIVYTLPDDGRYIIGVTRYGVRDGTSVGDYRLILTREN